MAKFDMAEHEKRIRSILTPAPVRGSLVARMKKAALKRVRK